MATLGGGEEGRKERTKSLPLPSNKTAQRRWRNLTEVEKTKEKETFSQERKDSNFFFKRHVRGRS